MAKKKLFVALTVGTLALGAVAATAFTTRTVGSLRADEKEYSVTLNADNASTLLAQSTGGASFQFVAEGLTAVEGKLGTLAQDGYIGLAEGYSLNNLDKVVVDVEGESAESLKVWTAFEENDWVRTNLAFVDMTLSLTSERANYVRITASAETVINSITFTYIGDGAVCQTSAVKPDTYAAPEWKIIGNHTSSQWSFSDTTPITELNTKNKDLSCVEFEASIVGIAGTAFKLVKGDSWENREELSGENLEIDSKYFHFDKDGNIAVNGDEQKTEEIESVGSYHYVNIYLKVYADKVTAWVGLGSALENPVDLEDETLVKDVYFTLPEGWATPVYAHYWDNYGNSTEWPGVEMTLVEGSIYKTTYNTAYYTELIFHDGTDTNKITTTSPTDTKTQYKDGIWVEFGSEVEMMTLYCYHSTWENANAYIWNKASNVNYGNWPGTAMTPYEEKGAGYFMIEFPAGTFDQIIFNGNGKTADLTIPADDKVCYYIEEAKWETLDYTPSEVEAAMIYLKPNSNWTQGSARFAAYFFGNGETWVDMVDPDADGYYACEIPSGYPNVIFCRMNGSTATNNWDNKWDQTNDLTIPTNGNNLYTVKEGAWSNGDGTWSTYNS